MKPTLFLILLTVLLFQRCGSDTTRQTEALAKTRCSSCHQYPNPSLLDKTTWTKSVLPEMALRMGLPDILAQVRTLDSNDRKLIPAAPLLTEAEYEQIRAFYAEYAPEKLPSPSHPTDGPPLNWFDVRLVPIAGQKEVPNVTCVKIDPANRRVYAADEVNRFLWALDANGKAQFRFPNQPAVSHIEPTTDGLMVTYIGQSVRVTWDHIGRAEQISVKGQAVTNQNLLKKLNRPTQVTQSDLDADGIPELISCQFGFASGKFSVWKKQQDGSFQEHVVDSSPGAIRTVIADLNNDRRPDLVTLFAQGNERIMWFENQGNLQFKPHVLLEFPPVYGSSYFDLADVNGDKLPDIVYACGDNADYSQVLKPYHGLYVFTNVGQQQFKQHYFLPMDGAYQIMPRDFDGDQDIDLAAIAFYADNNIKEPLGFVVLENQKGQFIPRPLPISTRGRWLSMDAADIDGDGDIDIALGSHPASPSPGLYRKEWFDGPGVVYLLNKHR